MIEKLFYALAALLSRGGRRPAQRFASGLAALLYALYRLTPHRDFIAANVRAALPEAAAGTLAKTHVRLLLWAILDLLRFRRFAADPRVPPEVTIVGWEHYAAAQAAGKGVILVSAHYGCWELIPACVSLRGHPTTVLVQKPSTDAFDRLFRAFRAYAGVRTVDNDSVIGLRPILKALQQGETVGLVIDQHGESEKLFGTFFGHRVSLPEGPAFLARRLGTPIVPVLVRWQGHDHVMEFFAPLAAEAEPAALMQRIYSWLEEQIRAHPQNWLWSYNRWDKAGERGAARGARDADEEGQIAERLSSDASLDSSLTPRPAPRAPHPASDAPPGSGD